MNLVEIDRALRKLRLSGMADVLEIRVQGAASERQPHVDFLSALVGDELLRRRDRLAPDPDGFLEVRGHRVPYAVLANEPEVTDDPSRLEPALEESLGRLWTRMNESGRLR